MIYMPKKITERLKYKNSGLFFLSPTSYKHQFYGITSGFTRFSLKTKYACHGLELKQKNSWIEFKKFRKKFR